MSESFRVLCKACFFNTLGFFFFLIQESISTVVLSSLTLGEFIQKTRMKYEQNATILFPLQM